MSLLFYFSYFTLLRKNIKFLKVIKCWDELVVNMSIGEKIKAVCPPEKAYGRDGIGDEIPPNSSLECILELVDIESNKTDL
jgi:FKBP-type peptidyl-prolyl cis-trans isomerase